MKSGPVIGPGMCTGGLETGGTVVQVVQASGIQGFAKSRQERRSLMGEGIQRRASIRSTIGADVKADPKLAAYIKHMAAQAKPGSTGFGSKPV